MNFPSVKKWAIEEGSVKEVVVNGVKIWSKKEDYTPLKYLKTNGYQYIDTSVAGNSYNISFSIDIRLRQPQIYGYPLIFGSRSLDGGSDRFYVATGSNLKGLYFGIGDSESSNYSPADLTLKNNITYSNKQYYVNDTLMANVSQQYFIDSIFLMTCNFSGDIEKSLKRCVVGDLYSAKIYKNGGNVRDYIPVLDKTGRPAMYDKVNNEYYYNMGLGEFGYETMDGTIVEPYTSVSCIKTTGTQYVITDLLPSMNHVIEMDIRMDDVNDSGVIYGVRQASGGVQTSLFKYNSDNTFIVQSTNGYKIFGKFKRHEWVNIKIDYSKKEVFVDGVKTPLDKFVFGKITNPYYLFAFDKLGSTEFLTTMSLKTLKVSQDGNILLNYKPVLDKDNRPALYDEVSKTYKYSEVGEFEYEL